MEGKYRGKAQVFGPVLTDLKGMGKRSLEWDLNDWKWDGDVFVASPLSLAPSDCRGRQLFPLRPETVENTHVSNSSPSCSDEGNLINDKGKRELEKRRRDVVPDEQLDDLTGSLNLELGQQVYPIADVDLEEKSGKKTKVAGSTSNHPVCQVDDCDADLSNAKDYHRRHKVCDVHSKASKALVGNVVQRFCQQCSRFHGLQEFDEGKRSCRRRLAGHNRRRRKTHPETSVNAGSLNDERNSGYLLITLLRILCNLHSNTADQSKDQDLLSYLLRNLATLTGTNNNISGLLQGSQGLLNAGASNGTPEKGSSVAHQQVEKETVASNEAQKKLLVANGQPEYSRPPRVPDSTTSPVLVRENEPEAATQRHQLNNIDLNTVYNESEDCADNPGGLQASLPSQYRAQGLHKSFPAQTNAKSCSTYSSFLFSSSRSEAQSCTDRIVFKLFGKDPNDLPHVLRTQILDWLSHSPTDIEGYIRPGCIVLTLYLRLSKSSWYELCYNLSSSLSRLLDISNDSFWKQGWIYASLGHHAAFIYDGQVVLDTPLPIRSYRSCRISSISPIAVPASERVQFVVRGFNLSQSVSRLLCAVEGKYLVQENCFSLVADADSVVQHDEIQCLSFSCSMPNASGRGFIEVEDYGLSGSFFPFIIAEPEICSEVCTLERLMDIIDPDDDDTDSHSQEFEARNQALDFIHEMGWLLHRNGLKSRLEQAEPFVGLFPFERIKWLVEFAIDHNWCAVVRKLIDVLLSGTVDAGGYSSVEEALSEMGLLHTAVRRNCKSMVESLLTYRMKTIEGTSERDSSKGSSYLFIPDVIGPGGLTPLHVAACSDSSEKVLEALIDDPGMVGIDAWKNACDSTGLTPNDYASLRGHYSYIHLVQRKLDQNSADKHVMIDIPNTSDTKTEQKPASKAQTQPVKLNIFHTDKLRFETAHKQCSLCLKKLDYGFRGTTFTCRPAMLSLVAIAAVCVCVALLFKSSPEVLYVSKPFNWEKLDYGAM